MSKKTVLNEHYKGLVQTFSIPAAVHERNGKKFAIYGTVVPIHCCTPEQVRERSETTHHYCDIFTEELLAPLGELLYARLDDVHAEKVFINRSKVLLITSFDGVLAQWRCVPTFESTNIFIAGTPLVDKEGRLVSVVTAKRNNHYAISCFENNGGYFETTEPWKIITATKGDIVYGDQIFTTREQAREYIRRFRRPELHLPLVPVLCHAPVPRVIYLAADGRQIAHCYVPGVMTEAEYL